MVYYTGRVEKSIGEKARGLSFTPKAVSYMTEFDFLYLLERYGTDTALAALFVVSFARLFKKTALKNRVDNPVISFLLFLLGVGLFFVTRSFLRTLSGG